MSRGLGKLQREILQNLKTSCADCRGHTLYLADDVYDLRLTARLVANKHGYKGFIPCCFQASFSRAVKRLVETGYLTALRSVPVDSCNSDNEESWRYTWTGKCYVFNSGYRQIRFVSTTDKCYEHLS